MNIMLYQIPIFILLFFIVLSVLGIGVLKQKFNSYSATITISGLLIAIVTTVILGSITLSQPESLSREAQVSGPQIISLGTFNPSLIETHQVNPLKPISLEDQIRLFTPDKLHKDKSQEEYSNTLNQIFETGDYNLLSIFVTLFVTLICTLMVNKESLRGEIPNTTVAYLSILVGCIGAFNLFFSAHIILFYVGVELLSLSMIAFIAAYNKNSIVFSAKYWNFSMATSGLILLGIALYYPLIKSLTLNSLDQYLLSDHPLNNLTLLGFCFILIGVIAKLGFVPFQSSNLTIFSKRSFTLSLFNVGIVQFALFCGLTRFILITPFITNEKVKLILMLISSLTILYSTFALFYQKSIHKVFNYAGITFFAYLMIPLVASEFKVYYQETLFILVVNYLFSFIAIYSVLLLESLESCNDFTQLDDLKGLFWRSRFRYLILVIGLLSLAGFPLTLGFIGRFFLINMSISTHLWLFTGVIVIATVLSFYFYLKLIITLYMRTEKEIEISSNVKEPCLLCNWISRSKLLEVLLIFVVISLTILGLIPELLIDIMHKVSLLNLI